MHLFINNFALWHRNQARNGRRSTGLLLNKYYVRSLHLLLLQELDRPLYDRTFIYGLSTH
jgi:hypothetical protein